MALTIEFLPDRLNREPVVFRGLTTPELLLIFLCGFIAGLLGGIFPAVILHIWALIPTGALLGSALCVLAGGRVMSRLKRGRPDIWLYQTISAFVACRGFGDQRLIQQSAVWTIRRSEK
ncbi:TIGR03750 family conjugal transfer protein [Citrobacter portucalensis]|uniref:TIGR03750 family conjugal transfer protein n=1 Tax=Citrobacter portucalensis TaxID=1639133 RepID=UPI00226B92D8|nr:TIGR03750 family conjugal transfer protein [Citrobacter portucalensis]MCX8984252.1 TIGR03750 family conjugal transfer protein [Citrobacter portucalensis]